ncbi:hypothetical protein COHA_000804 [Chlorella ohadii]|uniref:Thioredoxin reductase n=1 Tax=Chlorella ohadii TaxID=2649997 RepID=A0AAD5H9B9_9CHLO|nr:hypothetical protein COHA_000804 [Chlorella ohadii]
MAAHQSRWRWVRKHRTRRRAAAVAILGEAAQLQPILLAAQGLADLQQAAGLALQSGIAALPPPPPLPPLGAWSFLADLATALQPSCFDAECQREKDLLLEASLALPILVLVASVAFLLRPPPQGSIDEGRLFEDPKTGILFEAPPGAAPERDRKGELAFRPISYTPWPVEEGAEGERVRIEVGPVGSKELRTFVFTKILPQPSQLVVATLERPLGIEFEEAKRTKRTVISGLTPGGHAEQLVKRGRLNTALLASCPLEGDVLRGCTCTNITWPGGDFPKREIVVFGADGQSWPQTGNARRSRPSRSLAGTAASASQTGVQRRLALRLRAEAAGNGAPEVENMVIIGSGPAGYTAAIYAARANLRPFVFEGVSAGGVRGGQLMTTTEVENFPGFPEGITGPDLMDRMRAQAERWGARLETEDVVSVDLSTRPFTVRGTDTTVKAHSVIVATGATAKKLNLPSEQRFWSNGISACAICDGASTIFKQQELAVVGGGDTATEEAVYLTKYASHVHLLVRGDKMRASKAMQDRVLSNPKITVHMNTEIDDAYGDDSAMKGLHLRDAKTGEKRDLPVRGLFYGIGHKPNSDFLAGQIALDKDGYVVVEHGGRTSVEGVFAAGDLHDVEWRQAITAAGSGCQAALAAERYLSANGLAQEFSQAVTEEKYGSTPETRAASSSGADTEETFDPNADKHKGQFALRKLYHESSRPLIVLYTAPTCGPCRTLKPILGKVVDEFAGKVHYVEIDIEQDAALAEGAGVNGTPTVQIFKDKAMVETMVGVKQKSQYRAVVEKAMGAATVSA